jgi:hypothetical protein
MADEVTRGAARIAALVAVPLAIVVGAVAFFSLHGHVGAAAEAKPAPTASATSTASVTMTAPTLRPADAQMCLAFIAALPVSVRGLHERHVTAGPEQNIAFGDPAITAQCGAPKAQVPQTDDIFTMSDVCWHAQTVGTTTVWTTLDRPVPIAVTIPATYTDPGQWANEFSGAIVQAMPVVKTPYNC